jgi:alcohol dehydrogenase class IV
MTTSKMTSTAIAASFFFMPVFSATASTNSGFVNSFTSPFQPPSHRYHDAHRDRLSRIRKVMRSVSWLGILFAFTHLSHLKHDIPALFLPISAFGAGRYYEHRPSIRRLVSLLLGTGRCLSPTCRTCPTGPTATDHPECEAYRGAIACRTILRQVKPCRRRTSNLDMDFTLITVKRIIFGPGRFRDIGKEASGLGTRVFLVTGRSFLKKAGRFAEIEQLFTDAHMDVTVFDSVPPEPSLAVVEAGIKELKAHACDVVVAVGGGSALDVGKAIAGLAHAPGSVSEYFQGRAIGAKGLPFIAIPTTAGSGAEVTPNAVLTDTECGIKASIRSAHLMADIAIVDPELMLTCPRDVTAFSGMDALCQAVEAYVSRGATPLTDSLAADSAVRLIKNLPLAHQDGSDLHLRAEVALGSLMGAMAFTNARLGLVHGLAHPIGVLTGLPHGLICGLLLPIVMRFNLPTSTPKYAHVAREGEVADPFGSDEDAAESLIAEVESLNSRMGLDAHRPKLHIPKHKWPDVTAQALSSGSTKSNPREATARDLQQMLDTL